MIRAVEPLVSVIVIFLDQEAFLGEAIASVESQAFSSWELLLVDDGSTDGSSAIARAAARRLPDRVRYLNHPGHANLVMSASRNLGPAAARGPLLALHDGDDLWLPDKLERQVALMRRELGIGLTYDRALFWFSDPADARADFIHPAALEADRPYPPPSVLTAILDNENRQPPPCAMMLRTEVARAVGGWDERFRDMYEDSVFLAKALLAARVMISDDTTAIYRRHRGAICEIANSQGQFDRRHPEASRGIWLRWLERHLLAQPTRDPALLATVRRECMPYRWRRWYPLRLGAERWARRWLRKLQRRLGRDVRPKEVRGPAPRSAEAADAAVAQARLASLLQSFGRDCEAARLQRRAAASGQHAAPHQPPMQVLAVSGVQTSRPV